MIVAFSNEKNGYAWELQRLDAEVTTLREQHEKFKDYEKMKRTYEK